MWRAVEVVGVGDVVRGLFAGALVWGDVDPHCGVCLEGCVKDAHAREIVRCLAMR